MGASTSVSSIGRPSRPSGARNVGNDVAGSIEHDYPKDAELNVARMVRKLEVEVTRTVGRQLTGRIDVQRGEIARGPLAEVGRWKYVRWCAVPLCH